MQDEPDDASPFPNPPPYDEAAESFTWPPALPAQPVATASNFSSLGGRHGRAQTPRTVSAARLPSYKHALYGRYRTHPYRRPFKPTAQAEDYDYDNDPETEYVSIMDIITSPRYLASLGLSFPFPLSFPCIAYPTTRAERERSMSLAERANFLAARIAEIDAAMVGLDVRQLDELGGRVVDFILFVRRQYAEQREMALAPRVYGLI
ncbi:hypothetical protein K525DRAFT_235038 [Schizophyllum commune Loenen D]|nr:hypothetical protein K525DRAFT_235038 [Schizophyllum commune Loenen D]